MEKLIISLTQFYVKNQQSKKRISLKSTIYIFGFSSKNQQFFFYINIFQYLISLCGIKPSFYKFTNMLNFKKINKNKKIRRTVYVGS